ncbi:hypothetical protein COLO4_20291 [Corchorus olitorius]|uniref:F-box domain-containing protein n=1 Tax=Corchorus olitorius TaxID=93759 RepID=A0A1R3J0G9_9ROSI|nr:hypothetical protein COLO4_20291 [Corchorus olitorius]
MDFTKVLPEECLCLIISLTSPGDACRSALVSPAWTSVADSDAVWERFLPCDNYKEIISGSSSSSSLLAMTKKNLYFHLVYNPILIENGRMSFQLDKETGKRCYMLGARALSITCGETSSMYWEWKSSPDSRFSEVAELNIVWWLDIKGKIKTKILSSRTKYAAYLVFKLNKHKYGFRDRTIALQVNVEGSGAREVRNVLLHPQENVPQQAQERGDGWNEIKMGEFWNECGDDGTLECSLREADNRFYKQGLILEGIELRPTLSY